MMNANVGEPVILGFSPMRSAATPANACRTSISAISRSVPAWRGRWARDVTEGRFFDE